ncbi:hypothetical protein V8C42DRAFT_315814 [Trichoderma barbatum]
MKRKIVTNFSLLFFLLFIRLATSISGDAAVAAPVTACTATHHAGSWQQETLTANIETYLCTQVVFRAGLSLLPHADSCSVPV